MMEGPFPVSSSFHFISSHLSPVVSFPSLAAGDFLGFARFVRLPLSGATVLLL
jgi:hypothetical protein